MEAIVQCRLLFASLTDQEKKTFVSTIVKEFGSNFIANVIFDFFGRQISQFRYDQDAQDVANLNRALSTIIRDRKTKQPLPQKPCSLDRLPRPLVSNVASFLAFDDILSFQQCSRSSLVGIRALPLNVIGDREIKRFLGFAKDSRQRLLCRRYFNRFRLCGHFQFQFDDDVVPALKLSDISSWNDADSIYIATRFPETPNIGNYFFKELSKCDLSDVKKFCLYISHMNDSICDTLQQLTSLKTLAILMDFEDRDSQLQSTISQAHFSRMALAMSNMRDLSDLSLLIPFDYSAMLCTIAHNLQRLCIGNGHIRFTNCNFRNLQTLQLMQPNNALLQSLETQSLQQLKTLKLERVGFHSFSQPISREAADCRTLCALFTVPTLETVEIACNPGAGSKAIMALAMVNVGIAVRSLGVGSRRKVLNLRITGEDDESMGEESTNAVFTAMRGLLFALEAYSLRFQCLIVLKADEEPLSDFTNHTQAITQAIENRRSLLTYTCDYDDSGDTYMYRHYFKLRSES